MSVSKQQLWLIIIIVLLLSACNNAATVEPTVVSEIAEATQPPATPTNTPQPSETPIPTDTPTATATNTPTSTSTPSPTPTMTPTPSPTAFGGYNFSLSADEDNSIIVTFPNKEPINLTSNLPLTYSTIGPLSPDQNWLPVGRSNEEYLTYSDTVSQSTPLELWLISTNGEASEKILPITGVSLQDMSWSSDSQRLAFNCPNEGVDSVDGICIVNLENFEVTKPNYLGSSVSLSPDGKKLIFFGHDEDFSSLGLLVWQENSPTSSTEIELPDFSGRSYITWHPDGDHIIILLNSFVHKASIDENEHKRELLCELTMPPPFDILPSPDGSRLLVNAWMQKQYSVFDYDCGNLITGPIPGAYDLLEWTPDGKHIIANKEFVISPETGEVSDLPIAENNSN